MKAKPSYRVRLFLSVDLAGSTAFKHGSGGNPEKDNDPHPRWVNETRRFYRDFPTWLAVEYNKLISRELLDHPARALERDLQPQLWKSVGDELIFCCRVVSVEHAAKCCTAFLSTLELYGNTLDKLGDGKKPLDIKGAAWTAAFPGENVTVAVQSNGQGPASLDLDEEFEVGADTSPRQYDFLGKGIDAGFRVAKYASTDKFVVSVELAYLLAVASHERHFGCRFQYHGRRILKGVIRDRPYPIISIDTERNSARRLVLQRERSLLGNPLIDAVPLKDFLEAFMVDELIEIPFLPRSLLNVSEMTGGEPESYKKFSIAWQNNFQMTAQSDRLQEVSEEVLGDGGDIPAEVVESAGRSTIVEEARAPQTE